MRRSELDATWTCRERNSAILAGEESAKRFLCSRCEVVPGPRLTNIANIHLVGLAEIPHANDSANTPVRQTDEIKQCERRHHHGAPPNFNG